MATKLKEAARATVVTVVTVVVVTVDIIGSPPRDTSQNPAFQ
jgi:hypothetical protein